jgi:hypothetical protein
MKSPCPGAIPAAVILQLAEMTSSLIDGAGGIGQISKNPIEIQLIVDDPATRRQVG